MVLVQEGRRNRLSKRLSVKTDEVGCISNRMTEINTKTRLSFKTSPELKKVLIAISDIEAVSIGDTVHQIYRDKFLSLEQELDLHGDATAEILRCFDVVLSLD